MSENSFQVYRNAAFELAFTMIVKSEYTAQRINDRLLYFLEHETDLNNPSTWKYYMNLAGQYHPTDTVMQVISSDNLDVIDFTPANLVRHPNTRRDYQFGTRQYGELLEKYPDQEEVILGILYPVDKAVAISSRDHKILGYPSRLIEVNEYTLVEKLQGFIDLYYKRYYNWQYTISDSLAFNVALGMLGINLYQAILTYRHKKHKTIEAHSYFVTQYLASNSDLGKYHKFMSLEQAMYFYRNVRYHQRHPGTNNSLDMLSDALMTKRDMPIASYTMRHDTENQTEDIYPELMFKRQDMTRIASAGAPLYTNLELFMAKESNDTPSNEDEISYSMNTVQRFMQNSPSNVVQTKVLESAMIDYAGAQTYRLEDVQVAHWLYYASIGRYTAIINVSNPKTAERIILSVKDAYLLAVYCMAKSFEVTLDTIPLLGAQRVQRYPLPTDEDLRSVADMPYVSEFTENSAKLFVTEVESMISIDSFYNRTIQLHRSANHQRNLVAFQEGMYERGETFLYISRYWQDAYVRLEPEGTNFNDWLFSKNLNFDTLSRGEFETLYAAIVSAAIGKNLTTTPSLRNIQRAMAGALKDLSSYTIQVATRMADDQMIMTDMPSVRVGHQDITARAHQYLRIGEIEPLSIKLTGVNRHEVEIDIMKEVLSHNVSAATRHYLEMRNGPYAPSRGVKMHTRLRLSRFDYTLIDPPDVTGQRVQPLLGVKYYLTLTDAEKLSLFI